MKPGRNDPCPCGSGKKYKNCHARTDAADAPKLRLLGHDSVSEMQAITMQAISRPVIWEADVTPVPASVETHPTSRSAALMLAAENLVLDLQALTEPPNDGEGVATLIAEAIATLIARGGAPPLEVFVRHVDVAECLAPKLRRHGVVPVEASRQLPMIDEFAAALRQHLTGGSIPLPAVSCPPAWAGWGLPDELVGALHVTAASFYTAKPWELLENEDTLELTMPSGSRWFAAVMGAAGEAYGLAMYESLDDVHAVLTSPRDAAGLVPQFSVVLSLTFDFRADLEKPMRREASDKGWPIAGPSAYPVLWAMNTIGGGVSESQMSDLTYALEAIGRFSDRLDNVGKHGPLGDEWTDEATGTVIVFSPPLPVGLLWDVPARLSTSLPEGARANPDDLCLTSEARSTQSDTDAALLARFVDAARAVGTKEKRITQDRNNVAHFIEVTRFELGLHLPALTELDLRFFLYDLMPRRTLGAKSYGHDMRQSLKRFFAYLAASEELRYPWAAEILGDKFALDERWDSRPERYSGDVDADFEWTAELMDDLAARVMLPQPPDTTDFNGVMRPIEAALYEEVQRLWLVWRDEEIRAGVTAPDGLREKLAARQAQWDRTPQPKLDGRSPAQVIAEERKGGRRISRKRR